MPLLGGLLALAVVGLVATLAVRFEAALSAESGKGAASTAATPVRQPPLPGAATGLPLRPSPVATPGAIAVGGWVEVAGAGASQLRVRQAPGAGTVTLGFVPDGTRFLVIGGPQQADGYAWWQVEDRSGLTGWAAAPYLRPLP